MSLIDVSWERQFTSYKDNEYMLQYSSFWTKCAVTEVSGTKQAITVPGFKATWA